MCLLSWVYSFLLLRSCCCLGWISYIVCQSICSFIVVTYIHLYKDLCFFIYNLEKEKESEIKPKL